MEDCPASDNFVMPVAWMMTARMLLQRLGPNRQEGSDEANANEPAAAAASATVGTGKPKEDVSLFSPRCSTPSSTPSSPSSSSMSMYSTPSLFTTSSCPSSPSTSSAASSSFLSPASGSRGREAMVPQVPLRTGRFPIPTPFLNRPSFTTKWVRYRTPTAMESTPRAAERDIERAQWYVNPVYAEDSSTPRHRNVLKPVLELRESQQQREQEDRQKQYFRVLRVGKSGVCPNCASPVRKPSWPGLGIVQNELMECDLIEKTNDKVDGLDSLGSSVIWETDSFPASGGVVMEDGLEACCVGHCRNTGQSFADRGKCGIGKHGMWRNGVRVRRIGRGTSVGRRVTIRDSVESIETLSRNRELEDDLVGDLLVLERVSSSRCPEDGGELYIQGH